VAGVAENAKHNPLEFSIIYLIERQLTNTW
jgi:hypothetical protein